MKIKSAIFDRSASAVRECPPWHLPEFALIGRSNVGKSSLINLLADQKNLAKVSGTPGKTQLMNFFVMNGNWALVDLPGYGYANVGQAKRFDFNRTTADFLSQRENLRCVFVLIDSRLEPQAIDLEFISWLVTTNVPFAVIFTKVDKQSSSQTLSKVALFKRALAPVGSELPEFLFSSAINREGRSEILRSIERRMTESSGA